MNDPDHAARVMTLLYDGAVVGGRMDRVPSAAADARAMAQTLLD